MADRVGQQLGNYRLIRLLGRGGFAEVYLGEHIYLKTQAAIKILQMRLASEDIEGFLNEARTIAGLKHPHIIRVLDFGIDAGTPFLVMDYAPHGTLRQRHPKGVPLPLPTIMNYVKQVAPALQYAHERKLVHRDVKPENLLLGGDDEALLSDFGIALVTQSSGYQSTQEVVGTAAYMAPEQFQGKPRPASDQYSLGIVVYEWLCGDRPFRGTFTELYSQHMFVPPLSLREKIPIVPLAIEQVVLMALAKDPKERFACVQSFAQALNVASEQVNQSNSTIPPSDIPATPQEKTLAVRDPNDILPLQPVALSDPVVEMPQKDERSDVVGYLSPKQDSRFIAPRGGVGPTPANPPTRSPSLPAGQTPISPNYGYDKPVTIPLAQFVDSPLSQDIPAQPHTEPQSIRSVSPQDDTGPKVIELPQPSGRAVSKLPTPAIVPTPQPQIPSVHLNVGGGSGSPGNPRRRVGLFLILSSLILLTLLVGGLIAYTSAGTFGYLGNIVPGIASSATITITPANKDLKNTYTIFGVTGNPDTTLRQVQARKLTSTTPAQSKTAAATGVGHTPGVQATGTVTFYSGASVDQLVDAGTTFTLANGVQIVTDRTVDVPSTTGPPAFGIASVPAHAVSAGTSGNIAALTLDQRCCSSGSLFAKNLTPFSGGQDPQTYTVVQQSDIDGVVNPLKLTLMSAAQQSLQAQVQPGERFISPPQCMPNVSSDHATGDQASSVTVMVKVSCTSEVYDQQNAQILAANLLKQQAATDPGSGYALVGNLITSITQVIVTGANKGTLKILINAEGVWAFQFSDTQRQALAKLIAGKSKQAAQTLLLQQAGVTHVNIQLSGGDGKTLPANSTQVNIVVLNMRGL